MIKRASIYVQRFVEWRKGKFLSVVYEIFLLYKSYNRNEWNKCIMVNVGLN